MYDALVRTIRHRGLTIEIHRDDSPENPFTAWDCQPPILIDYDRSLHGYAGGDDLHGLPFLLMADWQISRHWRKIAEALDVADTHDKDAREHAAHYNIRLAAARRDLFGDALDDLRRYGSRTDYMDALAELLTLAGIVTLRTSSTGYCQGDYADLLLAYTPDHAKACGDTLTDAEKLASLEADAQLYGYWAWGDVYGYVISDDEDDHIDSCWGFYGESDDECLIGEAKAAADYIANKRDKAAESLAESIADDRPDLAPTE